MALLWNSLATRKTRLLTESLQRRFAIDPHCSWVNYIRCHDDIGWTFDDNIAWQLGMNPDHHRQFLNHFYTGQFPGSFASGVPFQQNPVTGDCRVAGMLASLAGVDKAEAEQNQQHLDHALARIYLLNSIILSIGGLPLLYMGDELGLRNDYSYVNDPAKKDDSRWVNRVAVTESQLAEATQAKTLSGRIYQQLQHLVKTRASLPVLGDGATRILTTDNPHLFSFERELQGQRLRVVANFSEHPQYWHGENGQTFTDTLTGAKLSSGAAPLAAYQVLWLIS
jgi:amylosucrase